MQNENIDKKDISLVQKLGLAVLLNALFLLTGLVLPFTYYFGFLVTGLLIYFIRTPANRLLIISVISAYVSLTLETLQSMIASFSSRNNSDEEAEYPNAELLSVNQDIMEIQDIVESDQKVTGAVVKDSNVDTLTLSHALVIEEDISDSVIDKEDMEVKDQVKEPITLTVTETNIGEALDLLLQSIDTDIDINVISHKKKVPVDKQEIEVISGTINSDSKWEGLSQENEIKDYIKKIADTVQDHQDEKKDVKKKFDQEFFNNGLINIDSLLEAKLHKIILNKAEKQKDENLYQNKDIELIQDPESKSDTENQEDNDDDWQLWSSQDQSENQEQLPEKDNLDWTKINEIEFVCDLCNKQKMKIGESQLTKSESESGAVPIYKLNIRHNTNNSYHNIVVRIDAQSFEVVARPTFDEFTLPTSAEVSKEVST